MNYDQCHFAEGWTILFQWRVWNIDLLNCKHFKLLEYYFKHDQIQQKVYKFIFVSVFHCSKSLFSGSFVCQYVRENNLKVSVKQKELNDFTN